MKAQGKMRFLRNSWEKKRDDHPELFGNSLCLELSKGLARSSVDKESASSAGDLGSVPGLGRSPGEGNGNPL